MAESMTTRALLLLSLVPLLAMPLRAAAVAVVEPEEVGLSGDRLGKITEFVEREIADGNLVGTVTLSRATERSCTLRRPAASDLKMTDRWKPMHCSVSSP